MTILNVDRPIPHQHCDAWGLLVVTLALPPKGSSAKPVTLSGHATFNRRVLGV